MLKKTKAFCDSLLDLGVPGFDLCVFQDGKCILRHINGYCDVENKIEMTGKERYNIYSCSKVITCVAALQLWEMGLFSLEDKLSDYMPEFSQMLVKTENGLVKAKNPILIRHLFEMTAGFSYQCASPELNLAREETRGRCPTRELMKYLAKEPLLFEPGERWEYSLCHDVLAALVEVIAKEKFEDYVNNNIFLPLGMRDSTFMLAEDELETITEQYRFIDEERVNIGKNIFTYKIGSEYASGGAGCISTVEDYMRFLEGIRTFKLLKPETVDMMTSNRLNTKQSETYWLKSTHGYGLGVRCPLKDASASDFGWGGAAMAYLAIDPQKNLSLYFGAHLLNSPAQGIRSMVYRFVNAELFAPEKLDSIYEELETLHNYHLTY